MRVLAGNTDDVFVTSIDILLDGNFTGNCVNDKIANCVISTTTLLLQFTIVDSSAKCSMRIGEELNTSGSTNVKSSVMLELNCDITMSNWLVLTNQCSSAIPSLFNYVVVMRDSTSSKISAHDTESLFVTSVNVLSDLKSLSSIDSNSTSIGSSTSNWHWVALGKVSAISSIDVTEHL